MKFHNALKPLYLDMDASGIGLQTSLLQMREGMNLGHDEVLDNLILQPIAFVSKSLYSVEWQYSNVQREGQGILHGLEKFHRYCIVKDIPVITDHKPLMAIDHQRCCNVITAVAAHHGVHTLVQCVHIVQTGS